jgi:hypothetical protein
MNKQYFGLGSLFLIFYLTGCLGDDVLEEPTIKSIGFTANITSGQTKVLVDSNLAVNFNAKINPTTITSSSFYVVKDESEIIVSEVLNSQCLTSTHLIGSITCDSTNLTCTLDLAENLAPSTNYLLCLMDTIKTADPALGTFVGDSIAFKTIGSFSVGGTITGLVDSVILQNNESDDLSLTKNGAFVFDTEVTEGSSYKITVLTQPSGQTCSVSKGSGNVSDTVTNITITCDSETYAVGGTIAGLTGAVVLQNNNSDDLTLTTNGSFSFESEVANGGEYAVTILTQPTGQVCVVTQGTGIISGNAISDVAITCDDIPSPVASITYPVSGTLSGLVGTLTLQNNTGDNLVLTQNGAFSFANKLISSASYNVTILTQPNAPYECFVTNNGTGVVSSLVNAPITLICDTSVLVIATEGGISYSSDFGNTFQTITTASTPPIANNSVSSVAGINDLTKTFAATDGGGLSILENFGQNIATLNTGTTPAIAHNTTTDIFVSGDGSRVYVATNGGISVSQDFGQTFPTLFTGATIGFANNSMESVYVSDDGTKLYVAHILGLSISTDSGGTWNPITNATHNGFGNAGNGGNYVEAIKVSSDGTRLYAGINSDSNDAAPGTEGGLAYSSDSGNTWTTITNDSGIGFGIAGDNGDQVYGLFVSSDGVRLYVATAEGLAVSTNSGASFSMKRDIGAPGNNEATDVVVNRDGTKIFVATVGGLAVSTDSGTTYSLKTTIHGLGNNEINVVKLIPGSL